MRSNNPKSSVSFSSNCLRMPQLLAQSKGPVALMTSSSCVQTSWEVDNLPEPRPSPDWMQSNTKATIYALASVYDLHYAERLVALTHLD